PLHDALPIYKDRGIFQKHARDGDALALPTGKLDTALADMGVKTPASAPVHECGDEVRGMGLCRGGPDGGIARLRHAVGNVVADRAVQQWRVLGYHADSRT